MGQRAHVLNGVEHVAERAKPIEAKPDEIEREIESLRGEIDDLVDELDRRRHDALDWRLQIRKHARPIALGAGVLLALALVARGRRRRTPALGEQLATLLRGAYAIGQHPERFLPATERQAPGLAMQLAKTAALAGASVLVRRMAERAVDTDL